MLFAFAVCGLLANAWVVIADPFVVGERLVLAASLTPPLPSTTSGTVTAPSGGSSSSGTSGLSTIVTTEVTTSVGPSGTSTFTTTLTSVSGGTASGTLTTTSFPSLSTFSSCVNDCLSLAVSQVNCTSITDVSCFCANGNFPLDLVGCVSSQCSDQLSSAESLARQFCNLASPSASLTFPPLPSNSSSSTGTTTSSTSTPAPSPTGNSSASLRPLGYEIFVAIVAGALHSVIKLII